MKRYPADFAKNCVKSKVFARAVSLQISFLFILCSVRAETPPAQAPAITKKVPEQAKAAAPRAASPRSAVPKSQIPLKLVRTAKKVPDLSWLKQEVLLSYAPQNEEPYGAVRLQGKFQRPDWELVYRDVRLERTAEGEFDLPVAITGVETVATVMAIGPKGDVEYEEFRLQFPTIKDWASWRTWMERVNPKGRRLTFSFGTGVTSQSYVQQGGVDFSQIGITVKIAADYALVPKRWILGGNSFFTALPLSSSIAGTTFRILGGNLRLGYFFPAGAFGLSGAWKLGLSSGIYFSSTYVTHDAFGYKDLMGPQIFPTVTCALGKGYSLSGYFKFSPISSGFSLIQLSSYELATGLGLGSPLRIFKRPVSFGFDYVTDRISMDGISPVVSTSMTLSSTLAF